MATTSTLTLNTVWTSSTSWEVIEIFTKGPGQTGALVSFTTSLVPFATPATSPTASAPNAQATSISSSSSSASSSSPSVSSTSSIVSSTSPIGSSTSSIGSSTSPTSKSPSVTTPTAQSTQSSSSSNLSPGAIAGISIGCAVAGLILGVVASFILFRRRGRQPPEAGYHAPEFDSQEKAFRGVSTDRLQLDQFLLDSTSDAEIGTELRSLNQLLQQHVESNYHLQPVYRSESELSQALVQLGLSQSGTMSAVQLASLALKPNSRYNAIQHVIARVAFASVDFSNATPLSLLPMPITSFVSMIPATERHRGNPDAINIALTRWRQLSAYLLHSERSDRTPLIPSEDISTHQAQRIAEALNTFLEPFVAGDREERYEQENHLREVIAECATFGYLLFSQPSEYRFRFDAGVSPNSIVTCPGLDKISDEEGRRYPPPTQPVVAAIVETI